MRTFIIKTFVIEMQKEKRTGIIPLMFTVGILGAAYAFANFAIRKSTLLNLPLTPMDVLLTQVYGMIMVLNMFGIITAACMIYHMEFQENAVKKMYMLPISVPAMYFCKFLILTITLLTAVCFQYIALAIIGMRSLPQGTFDFNVLLSFAEYSFITSMPVLSFMLFVSSRSPNMWVTLGIGIIGFLSSIALSAIDTIWLYVHPFFLMLKPAVSMNAQTDGFVAAVSLTEVVIFIFIGLWAAKNLRYD